MIRLMPITAEVLPQIIGWAEKKELSEYFRRLPATMDWLETYRALELFKQSYVVTDNYKPIGIAVFSNDDTYSRAIEFGAVLDHKDDSKAFDISREMMDVIADHIFNKVHYNRLTCRILTHRDKLRKRLEEYGFKFEGKLRQSASIDGKFVDEYLFALTREDFKRRK